MGVRDAADVVRYVGIDHPPLGAPSPVRLSTAVSCTCSWSSVSPPSCPVSGSEHVTPRFPQAGPDGHGSPPSAVLSGRYDLLLRMAFGLLVRQPAPCGRLPIRVRFRAPAASRPDDGPGSGLFTLAIPLQRPRPRARAGSPRFPGPHPATLRRSTTPDDPSRLAIGGATGAAPRLTTLKASSLELSRLTATLHRPLSTLHDGRYRSPCKTRFRLAGCAFARRVGCEFQFKPPSVVETSRGRKTSSGSR